MGITHNPHSTNAHMFFSSKRGIQKLASEECLDNGPQVLRTVTLDKNVVALPVGLTLGNTPDGVGVLVVACKQGGLAQRSGIRPGEVILTINEHTVGTHAEAVTLIDRSSRGITTLGMAHAALSEHSARSHRQRSADVLAMAA